MAGIFQNGIWTDGWDHYNSILQKWDSGSAAGIGTGFGRFSGSQGCWSGSAQWIWKNLLVQLPTVIVGFAIQPQQIPNSTKLCLTLYDTAGAGQQLGLAIDPSGRLQFYSGGQGMLGGASPGGSTLGPNSGSVVLHVGVYYYIEVKYTANGSTGLAECRLNGNPTPVITYTGNTLGTGNAWTDRVSIGCNTTATSHYYDDFYVLDMTGAAPLNTYLGDTRIVTLLPNNDSATAGLNQFGTSPSRAAGSHYLNVNENPPDDDTTYNFDATVGHRESYRLGSLSVTGAIDCVNAWARFEKDDATARSVALTTRSNAVDVVGATINTPTSYIYSNQVTVVDPNTSAAWTQAGVNAAEVGLKVIS